MIKPNGQLLTDEQIRKIKLLRKEGVAPKDIATRFGVRVSLIYVVLRRGEKV